MIDREAGVRVTLKVSDSSSGLYCTLRTPLQRLMRRRARAATRSAAILVEAMHHI